MSLSWRQIGRIAAAEAIRAHRDLQIDTTRSIDPFQALHQSGVLVMRRPLDRLSGAYLPANATEGSQPGVLINVSHPPSRQRFTAAHELWHHRRDQNMALDAETEWLARGEHGDSDRERLAEAFASWFLMPKRLIESALARIGIGARSLDERDVYGLSLELGTSYVATIRQLHGLGLISAQRRDRLLRASPQSIKRSLGDADVAADPWRDVRVVDLGQRGRTVAAIEGDVVVLELPEIPSTGYLWQTSQVPDMLNLVRDEYRPAVEDLLGGNGVHRFVFSVLGSGTQPIRFQLTRPWQPDISVEERNVGVIAQAKPASGVVDPYVLVGAAA